MAILNRAPAVAAQPNDFSRPSVNLLHGDALPLIQQSRVSGLCPLARRSLYAVLPIVADQARRSFVRGQSSAHLLDLKRLLFEGCGEGFDFLLLLRED